jgi:hypothetical protein
VKNRLNIILARVFIVFMVATTFVGFIQDADGEAAAMLIENKQPISVIINGRGIDFVDQNPQVINGRTLVPMRKIFEELGASISWDDVTKTVTAMKGNIVIQLVIGNEKANVNGVDKMLDVPGTIVNGRTMVPLRFVSEGLKSKVDWDSGTRTVVIVDNSEPPSHSRYNVLIIGDEITRTYYKRIESNLQKDANTQFIQATENGIFNVGDLQNKISKMRVNWDLIHYDYGRDAIRNGVSIANYTTSIRALITNLNAMGAKKIIFATAIPFKDNDPNEPLVAQFNNVAVKEINSKTTVINNMYEYVRIRKTDMLDVAGNGLNQEGKELAGDVVSTKILDTLASNGGTSDNIPYIAILGDSISGGYNLPLRGEMQGIAEVIHGATGFNRVNDWAKIVYDYVTKVENERGIKFSVIHFNWGLHALKYITDDGKLATPKTGTQCVPIEKYGQELEKLVLELKKTGAKLVWANTTYFLDGNTWGVQSDVVLYNEVADKIMKKHNIPTNNLYDLVKNEFVKEDWQGPVHFASSGYQKLARQIANTLNVKKD